MADKRNNQLLLPLDLQYEPQYKQYIKQHWNVTFARQKRMSVLAKRIIAKVIDQVREDDMHLRELYQIRIQNIIHDSSVARSGAYGSVQSALYELAQVVWEFASPDNTQYYLLHLVDTSKQHRVGYKDGIITIVLNPQLAPYFIQVAHYSKYQLRNYMTLRSWYSMRFFEILSAYKDGGEWVVSVEEYRKLMDCWHEKDQKGKTKLDAEGNPKLKYPNVNSLIKWTMLEPLEELSDTELAFTYEPIYEVKRYAKGRKKVTAFRFKMTNLPRTTIPAKWLKDEVVGRTIAGLRNWKVSDLNIALYLEDVGTKKANELVYEWQMKENSNRRIEDRVRYCNKVFVHIGKQIQQTLKAEVQAALDRMNQTSGEENPATPK